MNLSIVGSAFTIGQWSIQWYGIVMAAALLLGIYITMNRYKRAGLNPESVLDMALAVVPAAIVGARAHYVIWSWSEFAGRPFWHVFAVWEGGLAIFGAIIFGLAALALYSRRVKLPFLKLCDLLVPALALGQALGRWGNFFNQEVYGQVITNPALQFFPLAVKIDATDNWHQALFFYESAWDFLNFLLLFFVIGKKPRKDGTCFWFYLMMYGICRAILESFRESVYVQRVGNIPMNMLIAILLAVVGFVMLEPWKYLPKRDLTKKVVDVPDDLVLISERGKLKIDGTGAVVREAEDKPAQEAAESAAEGAETETTPETDKAESSAKKE